MVLWGYCSKGYSMTKFDIFLEISDIDLYYGKVFVLLKTSVSVKCPITVGIL